MVDAGKWVFYEAGSPLWFENPEYYKRRMIKKRLNYGILKEYCQKLGIDFDDEKFFTPASEAAIFEHTW
jgi:hypothetical protein